ncbi:hypothetical protein FH609_005010 [Streptomyces sp. 3MP-14]|uniref:Uncharacterized protein n=1 Tax=Streptomyces mimosae TaxID=2586635 RepID=A0A5N6AN73_9ACTN|nr:MULTISPECIES: hypothetical protein [Streptomyces]KAB8169665.1 hypothetical protein FH607_002690 [Streptomyces mimosae]KAB8178413.1 hypothetical protein FH609_005010 [Streptomyces sp. 3MP-14]
MTDQPELAFAEAGEAAELVAFLARQLRWDRTAAARLKVEGEVLAIFTRPARFEVLAVRPVRLNEPAGLDRTVSVGELVEALDEERGAVRLPGAVTGPSWAGVLPPRGGWRPLAELPHRTVWESATAVVAEFRERTEALAPDERTRATLDALAEEIWSRTLGATGLPLRAVHAAHALGLLRSAEPVRVLERGGWLRMRTALGSTAVRVRGVGGLGVTPV